MIVEGRQVVTYARLRDRARQVAGQLGPHKQLLLITADDSADAIECLVAVLAAGHTALFVTAQSAQAGVVAAYAPQWQYQRTSTGWQLQRLNTVAHDIHPELALMLSTSGSTGAVKYVRLSYRNLIENARSISSYLELDAAHRGLMALPVHFASGLSVLTSHLASGAAVLVSQRPLTDPLLWDFFNAEQGTSIPGVPHSYRLLDAIGFDQLSLPTLHFMTAAGGHLARDVVLRYADLAQRRGFRFYVMYGQTEAAPRMAYVPPALLQANPECIGVAIPGGRLWLVDAQGTEIGAVGIEGELAYAGPNVMMGYATGIADLAAPQGPQALHTGDLARRNAQGLYAISGRKSRFLKLFGLRISLDEIERRLDEQGIRSLCTGEDEQQLVVLTTGDVTPLALQSRVAELASLPAGCVQCLRVEEFPLLPSGKNDYAAARRLALAASAGTVADASDSVAATADSPRTDGPTPTSVRELYAGLFPTAVVDDDSSFNSLGGDSLTYVEASMALQRVISSLPADWPELPVKQLERCRAPQRGGVQIETTVLLRAAAMVTIVSNHIDWFKWRGGAYFLLVLMGYNFGRFTLQKSIRSASALPVLALWCGIAVPTLLTLWARSLKLDDFEPLSLVLLGNWITPGERRFGYWFLEVVLQLLLVLALVLSSSRVRAFVARAPFAAAAVVLAAGVALSLAMPAIWNTEHLMNRVPHMLLWMFGLGLLMQASRTPRQKALTMLAIAVTPFCAGSLGPEQGFPQWILWLWAGCALMLWRGVVRVPRPASVFAHYVAGASLFIFLFHNDPARWLRRAGLDVHPSLAVAAGLGLGVATWLLWERMLKGLRKGIARLRVRRTA